MADLQRFHAKSAIREVAAIANRKKVAVRAAFLFLSSQDALKAVPLMGLIRRALVNYVACCRRGRSDAAF